MNKGQWTRLIGALGRGLLPCLGCLCMLPAVRAQIPSRPPISTDRPSASAGSSAVPFGTFQLELGLGFERTTGSSPTETLTTPLLVRVGIVPTLELRYESPGFTRQVSDLSMGNGTTETGYGASSLGAKWNFATPADGLASFGILGSVELPVGSSPFEPESATPAFTFLADVALPASLSLTTNVGVSIPRDSETGDRRARAQATLLVAVGLGSRTTLYGEVVGKGAASEGGDSEGIFGGGLLVLLASNVQLDFVGTRGFGGARSWSVGGGLSFRLPY